MTVQQLPNRVMNLCCADDTTYLYGYHWSGCTPPPDAVDGLARLVSIWGIHSKSCTGQHVLASVPSAAPSPLVYDKYDPLARAVGGSSADTGVAPYWARWLSVGMVAALHPVQPRPPLYAVAECGTFTAQALAWLAVSHLNRHPEYPVWVRTDAAVVTPEEIEAAFAEIRHHLVPEVERSNPVYGSANRLLWITDLLQTVPRMFQGTVINHYLATVPETSGNGVGGRIEWGVGLPVLSCAEGTASAVLVSTDLVAPATLINAMQ